MELSKAIVDSFNKQLKLELDSAYIYLGMAAWAASEDLTGAEHWLKLQAQEEIEHAMRFYTYLNDRGGNITLGSIEKASTEFESLLDAYSKGLEHEKFISASIYKLYDIAVAEKDYASQDFLNWFVTEQVEEEDKFSYIVGLLEKAQGHFNGVMMIDRMLATREG